MKLFTIQNMCFNCGSINETGLGLTNSNDNVVYKCKYCKFIIFTAWMEEK